MAFKGTFMLLQVKVRGK